MKLVLYDQLTNNVLTTYENLEDVKMDSNNIIFKNGRFDSISTPFLLLDDTVEVPAAVTSDLISQNQQSTLPKADKDTISQLRTQLESVSSDLQGFMDFYFNSIGQ